jgi:hypothetical protein
MTVVHAEITKPLTATNFQHHLKGKILKIFSYKQGTEHQMLEVMANGKCMKVVTRVSEAVSLTGAKIRVDKD